MLVYSSVEDHVFPGSFPVPLAKQTTWQSCNRIANDVMTIANTAVEEAKFASYMPTKIANTANGRCL